MLHPVTWLGWVFAALVALSVTRNPLYLVLALLCIAIVSLDLYPVAQGVPTPVSPVRFAATVIVLSSLFNAVTVHFGDTVLFRLPALLPVIGGVITLEALAFGALNGLVLSGLFAAFTVFNLALSTRALVGLIPRAFYPVAVVISIAVTFVPTTLRQFRQIREAQAVRGHRMRALRDWLPLFMPLLISGLERALQLAEAMTARGFAGSGDQAQGTVMRAPMVLGLAALLGGWLLRLVWGRDVVGLGLMIAGTVLVVAALWVVGHSVHHTQYRSEGWTLRDGAVLLGGTVVLTVFLLPVPGLDRGSLFYYPYPRLNLPRFDPLIGVAILGLLGPALPRRATRNDERSSV